MPCEKNTRNRNIIYKLSDVLYTKRDVEGRALD